MKTKQHHVVYTDGGSITLRSFDTKEEMLTWTGKFYLAHLDNTDDYSVDLTFFGNLGVVNPYIRVPNEST